VHDKQDAINTLKFHGVIDYATLDLRKPTLADLKRAWHAMKNDEAKSFNNVSDSVFATKSKDKNS
jgi:hypothetical protein